jgi:hypothetical protein
MAIALANRTIPSSCLILIFMSPHPAIKFSTGHARRCWAPIESSSSRSEISAFVQQQLICFPEFVFAALATSSQWLFFTS